MAFDVEKIRERLERLKNGDSGGNKEFMENFWKPKKPGDGSSQIRLIANPHNDEEPFNELYFHYNLAGQGFICPEMTFGKVCPACEMRKQLFGTGKEMDKQLAKKFFPKARYYAVVIDRGDEEPKPKYWSFGVLIYRQLLEMLLDSEYGTFLDTENGLDMIVEQSKDPKKSFVDTNFKFRRKESPLADSQEEIDKILDSVKPFMEVFGGSQLDTKQIKERVEKFLSPDEEEEVEEKKTSTGTTKGKKSTDSVDDAFESLLNDEDVEDED